MKKLLKQIGFISIALIIGLIVSGCIIYVDPPPDNNPPVVAPTTAPANIRTLRIAPQSVFVEWSSVTGAASYRIYYSYDNIAANFELAGTTSALHFTDDEWMPTDEGFYKVSAVNSAGEGPLSAAIPFLEWLDGSPLTVGAAFFEVGFNEITDVNQRNRNTHKVTLDAGKEYLIEWNDWDNEVDINFADIEVGLVRMSTGHFVSPLVDQTTPPNRFTYAVPVGAGGDYYIIIRKITGFHVPDNAVDYDIRIGEIQG